MTFKSYDERIKEQETLNKKALEDAVGTLKKSTDAQKKLTTDTYNEQIDETADSYESLYDENAVQKLINEREVAENMANLGLTDSGLNRTQRTAVQLSYANNKNKIDIARQKGIDSLTSELARRISELDLSYMQGEAEIRDNQRAANEANAQSLYKSDLDAYKKITTERIKNQAKENYIIKANGANLDRAFPGTLADNGVSVVYDRDKETVTYTDENSGKKTTLPIWRNPYGNFNKIHEDLLTDGEYDPNKAFSNGYQPNNINGDKLKAYDTTPVNGNIQTVWNLVKGHNKEYYVWDGSSNQYVQVYKSGKNWIVK